jgi:succinyl-CoA synthetase alpha subunit
VVNPIIGTTTKEAVELFMNDPDTDAIVMIDKSEAASRLMQLADQRPTAIKNL